MTEELCRRLGQGGAAIAAHEQACARYLFQKMNVVVVAQANKMARTIWALLVKNREFDAHRTAPKAAA